MHFCPAAGRDGPGYSCACPSVQASRTGFLRVFSACCEAPTNRVGTAPVGASPSGKAAAFDAAIPRFESWRPSQLPSKPLKTLCSGEYWRRSEKLRHYMGVLHAPEHVACQPFLTVFATTPSTIGGAGPEAPKGCSRTCSLPRLACSAVQLRYIAFCRI